jgi:hypothetical protein
VTKGNDEFCQGCCLAISDKLMGRVNRWGFVHVGVRGKAFCVASRDVWSLFVLRGISKLVDSDLTGSFCFLSAVTGGALASLVAGSWALAMDKEHKELALPVAIYSFLIGYYMVVHSTSRTLFFECSSAINSGLVKPDRTCF